MPTDEQNQTPVQANPQAGIAWWTAVPQTEQVFAQPQVAAQPAQPAQPAQEQAPQTVPMQDVVPQAAPIPEPAPVPQQPAAQPAAQPAQSQGWFFWGLKNAFSFWKKDDAAAQPAQPAQPAAMQQATSTVSSTVEKGGNFFQKLVSSTQNLLNKTENFATTTAQKTSTKDFKCNSNY